MESTHHIESSKRHLEKLKERIKAQTDFVCTFCKNRFDQQEDLKQHLHQNECNAMRDHVMKIALKNVS